MRIRSQISLLLLCLAVPFLCMKWLAYSAVLLPAFDQLENEQAEKDVERFLDAIENELQILSKRANDWGAWDDTYKFATDRNETFQQANLVDQTFTNTDTDFLCFLNTQNEVIWGKCFDHKSGTYLEVPDLFSFVLNPVNGLQRFRTIDDDFTGVALTSRGAMLLASRPITTTDRKSLVRGAVVLDATSASIVLPPLLIALTCRLITGRRMRAPFQTMSGRMPDDCMVFAKRSLFLSTTNGCAVTSH